MKNKMNLIVGILILLASASSYAGSYSSCRLGGGSELNCCTKYPTSACREIYPNLNFATNPTKPVITNKASKAK
jgi:hypothetical protein